LCFVPRVLVTNGFTTRRAPTTTDVVTTIETTMSTQKTALRVSTDPTTENMHDSSSVASTLLQSTQTISCNNLSPSDRQEGVPISNEAYSISFRYGIVFPLFKFGICLQQLFLY
jgi:uncharacterized membrane protein